MIIHDLQLAFEIDNEMIMIDHDHFIASLFHDKIESLFIVDYDLTMKS